MQIAVKGHKTVYVFTKKEAEIQNGTVGIDGNITVPEALIYFIFLNIFNRTFISGSQRKRERTTPWVAG